MEGKKLPWFPFYPTDFLTDEKVMTMTYEEIGLYLTLLCYQWIQGSIPADSSQAQAMLKLGSSHAGTDSEDESFQRVLAMAFHPHPVLQNRLVNNRLFLIQTEQVTRSQLLSEAGKRGILAKARLQLGHKPGFSQASANQSHNQSHNQSQSQKKEKIKIKTVNNVDEFSITDKMRDWVKEKGLGNPDDHLDAFKDHFRKTGGKTRGGQSVKDWDAAFRTWMRNTRTFGASKQIGVER